MAAHFIYVHGFNSSPASFKAQLLIDYFAKQGWADRLDVPELPEYPQQAMALLESLVAAHSEVVLIGSSLGGFYTTYLTEKYSQARGVLINPAVAPHKLLVQLLGPNVNYYNGRKYDLTEEHLRQVESLYLSELSHPEKLFLLQQEGDETLDYRDAVHYYRKCEQIVQPGGNHGFENFDSMVPVILKFADRQHTAD
ncbi:YqiA/YcfP family alpha/beta fold hydrolase [Marinobacterium sp. LSUCC0821]|uniref:YqiA/YcfP family alpha/beta fold hydrolase n=1 Tax=Marinobacterium sp. LSUCC0821 TaxID=2668067 RepID=UPI00145121E9|nr:YqiA/YcfP family alpha/beta fold hydrolase [Marinobacterium sp. LSUCC0821]QJD72112.1 esterase [Marinobacterium sp. LSUCC0821]